MGKKRKSENEDWRMDQAEMAFAQRLYTPEHKKAKKEVQQELTEVNYHVKDWYPIYSDNIGGWQADLMCLNTPVGKSVKYRENAFLCVININSKYAFVRECAFTPQKNQDTPWSAKKS